MENTIAEASGRVAFRYPGFRNYILARFMVTASAEMQGVAVAWQVYGMTGRPFDLGMVGLAQFLPGMLLFLLAGHAADRIPRKHILLGCFAGFALCSGLLLAYTLAGGGSVYPIYAILLLNGVVRAFRGPAAQAFTPQLVPEEHFPNAVAWAMSVHQAATVLGPMAGGLVYGIAGSAMPVYAAAGVLSLLGFGLVLLIRIRASERALEAPGLSTVLEGFRYIWRNKIILGAISLDMVAVLLGGAVALLPVYAREILHVGAFGLGVLRGAPSAGAVAVAIIVAHRPVRRNAGWSMLGGVLGFGLFTLVFGLSRNMALSIVALALVGACDMVSVIIRHTMVQLRTPDQMRGRVSAVNMVFIGASNEVGQFESGITAEWFGTVPAVILGGIGAIVVVLVWARLFPELRRAHQLGGD